MRDILDVGQKGQRKSVILRNWRLSGWDIGMLEGMFVSLNFASKIYVSDKESKKGTRHFCSQRKMKAIKEIGRKFR